MPEHKHTPRPQRLTAIYAMLGGRTTSFRARISDDLALPPHASTSHFSAPIMFTALKTACFLITSLGLGAPAENGEAEVVLRPRSAAGGADSLVEVLQLRRGRHRSGGTVFEHRD